jgi:RNA polymerase sigma-B factor
MSPAPDDRDLLRRYRDQADERAREELVVRYLPMARRLAARYSYTREPIEDLTQVASVALLNAVERFDPERGSSFSSFAVPTILGELKRHFRDHGWAVHVPRDLQERAAKVSQAVNSLSTRLGHSPSVKQVAEALDLKLEEVLEALEAGEAHDASPLDSERSTESGETVRLADTIGDEEPRYELVEYGAAIEQSLQQLPARTRTVLRLRFVEDKTQAEIGEVIGVSQVHVSRIIRAALTVLRNDAAEWQGE